MSVAPLEPVTPAGDLACRRATAAAAATAGPGVAEADRAGRFEPAMTMTLQDCGVGACCVPAELGGDGVTRLRDLMAVAFRLGRADGSLALVATMHLGATWSLARARGRPGASAVTAAIDGLLKGAAAGTVWLSAAVTEAGSNYFHPATELRDDEGGWRLEGTKVFATGSPGATHLTTNVRIVGGPDHDRLATVVVAADTPGVVVLDDWDGLGMRASGSGRVRFETVRLPRESIVLPAGPYGEATGPALCGRAFGNVGNVAVMAGIADAARHLAVDGVRHGRRVAAPLAARATVRHALAELEVDHLAMACIIDRLGDIADLHASATAPPPDNTGALIAGELTAREFMADFQAAKLQVNRLAIAIVDRALLLSGGSGYSAGHPLARLARDVRAGPFMQPFSPHEALGFIGAVAAGTDVDPEA